MDIIQKIYFAEHPTDKGTFVAIKHREQGYNTTDVTDQSKADALNQRQGITSGEAQAAIACSMNNCWENFADIARGL